MRKLRRFAAQIPLLVIWLIVSVFLWSWIFTFLTDTDPAHKLEIYADMEEIDGTALGDALEAGAGEAIRMVRVHPFGYAMLDSSQLRQADLYIVKGSDAETYLDWFAPLPYGLRGLGEELILDGTAWGVLLRGGKDPGGAAAGVIAWPPDGEDYWLMTGAHSLHIAGREGAVDNEAAEAAVRLLTLR